LRRMARSTDSYGDIKRPLRPRLRIRIRTELTAHTDPPGFSLAKALYETWPSACRAASRILGFGPALQQGQSEPRACAEQTESEDHTVRPRPPGVDLAPRRLHRIRIQSRPLARVRRTHRIRSRAAGVIRGAAYFVFDASNTISVLCRARRRMSMKGRTSRRAS
jgi:hypothetical protein